MIGAPRSISPGGAIALAGVGVLSVLVILGIAGVVLGTQCQAGPGRCAPRTDPVVTATIAPAAAIEDNMSTSAMTVRPAVSPAAPPDQAAAPAADDLIEATFRQLPAEALQPLAIAGLEPDDEAAAPATRSGDPPATPLWTRVKPLEFSEPKATTAQAAIPVPARRAIPVKVAYAAEPPAKEAPLADNSAAVAVTSLAGSGVVKVGQNPLNVRAGPSASQERVFVLEPGTEVEVTELSKGWVHIVDGDSRDGWVDARYLANLDLEAARPPAAQTADIAEKPAAASPTAPDRRIVGGSGVNVRSGPSKASSKLFALAAGQEVTVSANDKGWLQVVDAQGRSGWIYKTFLSVPN